MRGRVEGGWGMVTTTLLLVKGVRQREGFYTTCSEGETKRVRAVHKPRYTKQSSLIMQAGEEVTAQDSYAASTFQGATACNL